MRTLELMKRIRACHVVLAMLLIFCCNESSFGSIIVRKMRPNSAFDVAPQAILRVDPERITTGTAIADAFGNQIKAKTTITRKKDNLGIHTTGPQTDTHTTSSGVTTDAFAEAKFEHSQFGSFFKISDAGSDATLEATPNNAFASGFAGVEVSDPLAFEDSFGVTFDLNYSLLAGFEILGGTSRGYSRYFSSATTNLLDDETIFELTIEVENLTGDLLVDFQSNSVLGIDDAQVESSLAALMQETAHGHFVASGDLTFLSLSVTAADDLATAEFGYSYSGAVQSNAIPEPTTIAIWSAIGLCGLALRFHRRCKPQGNQENWPEKH